MIQQTTIAGEVVKQLTSAGSKSEHQSVMLKTEKEEYKLRIPGGNPFHDERLETMVGLKVEITGKLMSTVNVLTIESYRILP